MEVDDAIKNIKMFHFKNLPRFKPELIELLKSLEAENKALKMLKQAQKDENKKECIRYQTMYRLKRENKKLKKFKDMWEWIQGVEMWNKEYEKIVKEVVQDIEVGYESGKVIEKIGYEKVEDKGLDDGIFNKQNQRYIKKINTFKKLKQENEAYKGIVEEIENDFGNGILQNENGFGVKLEHLIEIKKQKYLGGEK